LEEQFCALDRMALEPGHGKLTIEQVGRNRQVVLAVGGDPEAPLAASSFPLSLPAL
jgi:hypothetical protein